MQLRLLILLCVPIILCSADDWEYDRTLSSGPWGYVYRISFSPNGRYMAASVYPSVLIWETDNWTIVKTYNGSFVTPYAVKFSNDGTKLAVGYSGDSKIDILEVPTWKEIASFDSWHFITSDIQWSEDDTKLLDCGRDDGKAILRGVYAWSTVYQTINMDRGGIYSCKIEQDKILIGSYFGYSTHSTHNNASITKKEVNDVFCVDGNYMRGTMIAATYNGQAFLSSLHSNDSATLMNRTQKIWGCTYSRTADFYAFGGYEKEVYVFDGSTNHHTDTLTGPKTGITELTSSNNGNYLVAGTEKGEILIWKHKERTEEKLRKE